MGVSDDYKDLGMGRQIARRDFLNGAALSITGGYAFLRGLSADAAMLPGVSSEADYPPARRGLRGQYPAAVEEFGKIREGKYRTFPHTEESISEEYDLVIVGGGISGLSAAYFYQTALGPEQKILILDNHDDFGGHAKRNEFQYGGKTYIGFGGTMGIETPYPYSYCAKALIRDLGIEVERRAEFANREIEGKYDLGGGIFFDREHFGTDQVVAGAGRIPWKAFFEKAPLSDAARKDLTRLYGKNPDYLAGFSEEEKTRKLAGMSYQDFLLKVASASPDAIPFFLGEGGRNNKRVDTLPALEAAQHGAVGFNGMHLKFEEKYNEGSYLFHFPDGNASVARLLVAKLNPAAISGKQSMNTIVQAPVAYDQLDSERVSVRIRLGSSVVRVQHEGPAESAQMVKIAYVKDGKVLGVRARHCIMASYNGFLPYLMPELPEGQREALLYPVKVPMMYTNVLLRKWTAFEKLGVSSISAPCMYHTHCRLDPGTTVGGYQGVGTPEEPVLVHMVRNPNKPGFPRKEQNRFGQQELLATTFEQFELEIRRQLGRMLAPGGFDPAEDIAAITVNRWPYGYAYTYDTLADSDVPPEKRPHILGRQRFGQVTIANADAGAAAFTNQAIDEAHRAVQELLVSEGLT